MPEDKRGIEESLRDTYPGGLSGVGLAIDKWPAL
jgi:hypothetical protein